MSSEFVYDEEEQTEEPELIKLNMSPEEAMKKYNEREWLPLDIVWQDNSAESIDTTVQILYGKALVVKDECQEDVDWKSCDYYYYPLTTPVILRYTQTFRFRSDNNVDELWIFDGKKWKLVVLQEEE